MTGEGASAGIADRLPGLVAMALGPALRVGAVERLSGGASRQTWGVRVRDGAGRQHELVLRASDHDDGANAGMAVVTSEKDKSRWDALPGEIDGAKKSIEQRKKDAEPKKDEKKEEKKDGK